MVVTVQIILLSTNPSMRQSKCDPIQVWWIKHGK